MQWPATPKRDDNGDVSRNLEVLGGPTSRNNMKAQNKESAIAWNNYRILYNTSNSEKMEEMKSNFYQSNQEELRSSFFQSKYVSPQRCQYPKIIEHSNVPEFNE